MNKTWVSTIDVTILMGKNIGTRKESCFSAPLSNKIIKRAGLQSRGGSRFCGAWSLCNFSDLPEEKNTKLRIKFRYISDYLLKKKNKSQKITNLKRLTNTTNNTTLKKIAKDFLINWATHFYITFFVHFLAAYSLIVYSYGNDFVISISIERIER